MLISRNAGAPLPCVSVSTTEAHPSNLETKADEFGPESSGLHIYELADAINCLIDAGYTLGCDGELLPPKWAFEAFKGADA